MKRKKINCKTARDISIIEVLDRMKIYPKMVSNNEAKYLSPFRLETRASFNVSKKLNRWYDHGLGEGGNIIDLIILLKKHTLSEALDYLSEMENSFSFQKQPEKINDVDKLNYEITKIKDLENKYLLSYLASRKISIMESQKYCNEVHYKMNKRSFYAIGFKNDTEGYELRNKYFKGCLKSKNITTILNGSKTLCLFESFTDFLSYQTLKSSSTKEDYIILNSTATVHKTISTLTNYNLVRSYFDHDNSGIKTTAIIKNNCRKEYQDCSKLYKDFKDLNDYLMNFKP